MILTDFTFIFRWWGIFFILGIIFLSLTTLIFKNFFDRGYIFSKIFGVLLISFVIWILASLHLISFQNNFILLISFIIFIAINLYISQKQKIINLVKTSWKIFLLEEVLFTIGLITWSFIKGFDPSVHSLEKFMDFGFINSILRTEYFPPKDIWLAPHTINYYYFGHLVTAVLFKLSYIKPEVSYNLMVASLFALTLSASFSISSNIFFLVEKNIKKVILAGLLGAFLVTMSGNLHTIYTFFENYPTDNPVPPGFLSLSLETPYWYPNATRFIPNTIHEFPLYSFVVSDLHGHVLGIPIVLTLIALLVNIFIQEKIKLYYYILLGFTIALAVMTNTLDGPIYLMFISLIIFFKTLKDFPLSRSFAETLKALIIITFSAYIFSLPFWLNFKPFASSIGVLCAPEFLTNLRTIGPFLFEANHCERSPFWMLIIIYGFFFFTALGFIVFILNKLKRSNNLKLSDYFILVFILFGITTIFIPEFIYLKDIYPAHYRANTVFKFGFQAFIILSIVSSYILARIFLADKWHHYKIPYTVFISSCLILVSIYPYFAITSYYGHLKNYKGLDGLNYMKDSYPEDLQTIKWLNQNVKGQPIILEGVGQSYSDYARISANTGLPTVIGWPVHEWLWRGSPDEGTKRSEEVKIIYETDDINIAQELLKKYNVSYIVIGDLERQKYLGIKEEKFYSLGDVVFQQGNTIVLKIFGIIQL